ncbi:CysA [Desulforapulum autotrophicum HRM2]|uniref:CysA n=1 Tax=Desulforapulum autotrophicum (strain ATCC 43914 / DSM 3382 / VKM B-1955 / HRM2) TaxID=177437 RepID=C0QLM9_DESAH|nr:ATP-binding cassette domain-containing protein [Desulforapulum autotrophicum]ACN16333.1 CysA [Desulforapulum autotrophicum HRM2]
MIRVSDLSIRLTGFSLESVNLEVKERDFFALIGPTGSGKSLLLEAIMGLMPIDSGGVFLEEQEITKTPPEHRGLGIVYQDYALFPHLDVQKNIRYGVRYHDISKVEANARFESLVETMNLSHLLNRHPLTLSGGEKQRVALCRALILNPRVLLLDEPLSALDPVLQDDIKNLLKSLHKTLGTTFVMVSHDFSDVLFLANRGAIIHRGKIEQTGTIQELFERPGSPFAARFVGMKNVFPITGCNDSRVSLKGLEIFLDRPALGRDYLAVRPEEILCLDGDPGGGVNRFSGRVQRLVNRGFYFDVFIQVNGVEFMAQWTRRQVLEKKLKIGDITWIFIPEARVHTF